MSPALVIIFWLFFAGIYGVIFLLFAGLWFLGRKKKLRWLKWLAGIPAISMIALAGLAATFISWEIIDSMNPRSVFKEEFGVPPPASVSHIQSSYYQFADCGNVYLRFEISEKDFKKLVPVQLQKKTVEEFRADVPGESGDDLPTWWDCKIGRGWTYYLRVFPRSNEKPFGHPGLKGFASETEFFAYNPSTHLAYYHFIGID
jgi:hypothetical protein